MHNPYVGKIVDLVNPYVTPVIGQPPEGHEWIAQWLENHPGRWALVGEHGTGLARTTVDRLGWQSGQWKSHSGDMKIYARIPHPEGEDLLSAMRRNQTKMVVTLPEVTTSDFQWTPEELAEATRVARENLFPVSDRS